MSLSVVVLLAGSAGIAQAATKPGSHLDKKPGAHPAQSRPVRHYGGPTRLLGIHVAPTAGSLQRSSRVQLNQTTHNLQNYGGPVMSDVRVYNIYWLPPGGNTPNQGLIDRYTQDIGGPYAGILAQYGVENRINYGGSWTDTRPLPQGPSIGEHHILQDSDVKAEIIEAQNANPGWQPPGLSTLYVVYLPIGTELCQQGNGCTFAPNKSGPGGQEGTTFCAYHGAYVEESAPNSPIVYAAMPYDGDRMAGCGSNQTVTEGYPGSAGPNGDTSTDSEISTASHEIFEALTDPEVGQSTAWSGGNNALGPIARSGEIGDLCAYLYSPSNDGGDVTLNGDRYFLQYEWSNATSSCVLPNDAITPTTVTQGCAANTLVANDDGSTGSVALPFAINYFGQTYNATWVNNNGNITFNGPLSTYTPFPLLTTSTPIIAPYFSDVDTRGTSPLPSGLVTYGATTYLGHQAFCVDWRSVGYYGEHTDKLSSFQLLLVERGDTGTGNFDIVFDYDRAQWETGDASGGFGGFGGGSARAGFSNGTTNSLELVGSGVNGDLLDWGPDALSAGSHSSTQPGRYVFAVRNGTNAGGATIEGRVTDAASPANPVIGALVQACGGFAATVVCDLATTSTTGDYSITSLPAGFYTVTVSPPAGSSLEQDSRPLVLLPNETATLDFSLLGPAPPPHGTEVGGTGATSEGIPVVYWQSDTPITTHGCRNGSAKVRVTAESSTTGTAETVTASLAETPAGSGTYEGFIPALYPLHGNGEVTIEIKCPHPEEDATFGFTIYIDPSGTVVDAHGAPVAGATVTLLRGEEATGPFVPVEAGSAVMSPGNRANPMTTDDKGSFGWDVLTGFYRIQAEKLGCHDPADPAKDYVQSEVLEIPPAAADVNLVLACSGAPDLGRCTKVAKLEGGYHGGYRNASCTATSESKTGKYEWTTDIARSGFTMQGSTGATFETPARAKVTCAGAAGQGMITGSKTVGSVRLAFTGCESSGQKCTTPGAGEAGEIETASLEGVLGWEDRTKKKPALALFPLGRAGRFVEYRCGATSTTLTGALLVGMKSDKMTAAQTLKLLGKKGKQKPLKLEEAEGDEVLLNEAKESVGLTVTMALASEEPVEINAVL